MSQTTETLELMKGAQASASQALAEDVLAKGITQATGLVAYDLEAPSKKLYPVLTPLRNRIARVGGRGGTAIHYKQITAINTNDMDGVVSEGNRGAVIGTAVADVLVPYVGLGLEDYVTFEADYAAQNFEDVKAGAALRLLQSLMIDEEKRIFGANRSLPLGTTPTPTVTTSTTGGSIPATTPVSVICVALTHAGYSRSTVAGGLTAVITKTNADASTDSFGGGVAQKSANASVTTGAGSTNSVAASVAPVRGAVAYAWYVGAAGSEYLMAITTINSVVVQSLPTAGQLASALPATDNSTNAMSFDGLLSIGMMSGNGSYYKALPTGTAGTGSPLTSNGAGGIKEFDDAFRSFWDLYRLSPDEIHVSAQELLGISKLVVANGGAPLIRFDQSAQQEHISITAGVVVGTILNPIMQRMVKVVVHPNAVPGTILFVTWTIPYPISNLPAILQIQTRRDYYQLEWPLRTRKYEYGVYADEALKCYVPFAFGTLTNIAPTP